MPLLLISSVDLGGSERITKRCSRALAQRYQQLTRIVLGSLFASAVALLARIVSCSGRGLYLSTLFSQ